ncbi:MAG: dihydroneopterin aldolase [Alphaproteobacteria bacterium]|nr:dihydroneopterin aldolase [Alphaproteobacteria bacterium]
MPDKKNSDYIFIRDLQLEMSTGIYDKEKEHTQRVLVNIEIQVKTNKNKLLTGIDDVLSYETVVNEVKALSQTRHFELLEEFCEEIAGLCLKHTKTISAHITAEKPDIIESTNSVGVKILRVKQD